MVYSFLDYGFDIDDHHFKLCEPSGIKPLDYFKNISKIYSDKPENSEIWRRLLGSSSDFT